MLIYHLGGHTPNPFGNDNYTAHAERGDFMSDLHNIGNYPQYCKKVALSNGSMEGERIKRSYGTNPPDRYPGDYFLDFETEVYVRFIGFKIKVFGIDLEVQSNPDPGGQIMLADAGTWVPIIKLKKWGIKITVNTGSVFYQQYDAQCKGYCVNAAGVNGTDAPFTTQYNHAEGVTNLCADFPDFFGLTEENDGNGKHTFDIHIAMPGFDGGAGFSAYSDGFAMGFVPVQSALDYGTLSTPQPNIMSSSVSTATKMSQTPFDVIVGMTDVVTGSTEKNWDHLNIRNEASNTYCLTCSTDFHVNIPKYSINREIGDEDIYVDNMILPRTSHFEAERNMYVDVFNPNYSYPTISTNPLHGMYSKENKLQIINTININGFGFFQYDSGKNGVFVYNNCNANTCSSIDATISPCCINFALRKEKSDALNNNDKNFKLLAFPNPTNGKCFSLIYDLKEDDLNLQIYNVLGSNVFESRFKNTQSKQTFNNLELNQGIYLIRLTSKSESLQTKLIVNY